MNRSTEILEAIGFYVFQHNVSTSDGYVLNLLQVTNPLAGLVKETCNRQPVLFVHGVSCSSLIFVIRNHRADPAEVRILENLDDQQVALSHPNAQTAATLLLDLGHEVWLLDRRGPSTVENRRKDKKDSANIKSKQYWDFSLDEQAQIDIPEVVDYVLQECLNPKVGKVSLVGHSLGATLILMALSANQQLEKKGKFFQFALDKQIKNK